MNDVPRSSAIRAKQPRRWRRRFALVVCLLLFLVLTAPWLAKFPPVRDWVVGEIAERQNVRVQVREVSLGWFTPVELNDLHVEAPYGDPLVDVKTIRGDRPWWQLAMSRKRLGRFLV